MTNPHSLPLRRRAGLAAIFGALVTAPFSAHAVEKASLRTTDLDCLMEPRMTIKLGTPTEGIVSKVEIERGDIVKAGQVVARLESAVEEATLALARAKANNDFSIKSNRTRAEFLRRKTDRAERLKNSAVVAEAALDETSTEARVAEFMVRVEEVNRLIAQLEAKRSEELLNQKTIRSPVDGVVVSRSMSPGEFRGEQSHVATIAQINPLNVEVIVPIAYYSQIRTGTKAEIRPESPVEGTHLGTVTIVDRVLDAASGTFGVRLELPNPDYRLPAGLRCKIRFIEAVPPQLEVRAPQPAAPDAATPVDMAAKRPSVPVKSADVDIGPVVRLIDRQLDTAAEEAASLLAKARSYLLDDQERLRTRVASLKPAQNEIGRLMEDADPTSKGYLAEVHQALAREIANAAQEDEQRPDPARRDGAGAQKLPVTPNSAKKASIAAKPPRPAARPGAAANRPADPVEAPVAKEPVGNEGQVSTQADANPAVAPQRFNADQVLPSITFEAGVGEFGITSIMRATPPRQDQAPADRPASTLGPEQLAERLVDG